MKAYVLYSGGKDSSLMAILLNRMDFDVELLTVNFGVYDSYISASKSAELLSIKHDVLKLNKNILNEAVDIVLDDGFLNNGINYLHNIVIEELADLANINGVSTIADGTRRDDRVPKLDKNKIRSLEDRENIQYVNLDSFGYKTIETLASNLFKIKKEKSESNNNADYEVEIRYLIDNERNGNSKKLSPEHFQTSVVGLK